MQTVPSWRWPPPMSSRSSSPKNPFLSHSLAHTMSMADLHDQTWTWGGRPPSSSGASSSSSSSYDEGAMTPTASDYATASRSRTPTPTAPAIQMPFTTPQYGEKYTSTSLTNPWARSLSIQRQISPPVSPRSSPSSHSTSPESQSRSSTPVAPHAPQPLRPFIAEPELVPARYETTRASTLAMFASAGYPTSPTPAPYTYSTDVSNDAARLPIQFITPELIQLRLRLVSALVPRQGWGKSASIIYQWAIKHPKTALLLWMANDLASWRKANVMGLEDAKLPYTEADLVDIAAEPSLVVELQWRVAIKQLPRDGKHTEFQTQETVPLREVRAQLAATQGVVSKRLDCVVYCDSAGSSGSGIENGGDVYVRKRLDITNKPDKESLLAQLRTYHSITSGSDGGSLHPNLSPIISSYARGQTVAFLTRHMPSNLDDFLDVFAGPSIAEQLLRWIKDLASVMSFLHERDVFHGAVRPQKILVDDEEEEGGKGRVQLAVFGVRQPARAGGALFAPYSTDPAYIYAAPESMSRSTSEMGTRREAGGAAADVFALGCVFLEMVTAARGLPVSKLAVYRAAQSHDASYHANLERVAGWIEILKTEKAGGSTARKERVNAGILRVLNAVRGMVLADPTDRPSMKRVLAYLEQGESVRKSKEQQNASPPRARDQSGRPSPPREQSSSRPSPPREQSARLRQVGRLKTPRRRSVDIAMELTRPEMVVRPELTRLELRPELTMRRAALVPAAGIWGDLQSLNGYYRERE